jgi:hypothetical protein
MTPRENTMLATLLSRLEREPQGAKDADAEAMIQRAATVRPDLAYLLAQTILVQELALQQARDRLAAAEGGRWPGGDEHQTGLGFLGGLHGRNDDRRDPPALPAPLSLSSPPNEQVTASGPSFLASAAATAAGVAGGALLFQSIQSMFGPAVIANLPQQPSLAEGLQAHPAAEQPQIDNAAEAGDPVLDDEEIL